MVWPMPILRSLLALFFLVCSLSGVVLAAGAPAGPAAASAPAVAPLRVVALHSVLAEFARRIAGPDAEVSCLLPAGSDPHSYSPAPADVIAIGRAELVLASGFEFEPYLGKLVRNSGTRAPLFEAASVIREPVEAAAPDAGGGHAGHDHEHGEFDPHWWHSLRAASDVAGGICARLSAARPEARTRFEAGLAALRAELATLETWAAAELVRLPPARRQLVTSHDAFGYLARDLGFTLHPLHGVSPEAEPDARTLARLIDFVSKNKIRAIFPDNTENPRLLAAMTRESGARLGGTLYADGIGAPGGPASDYAAMYRHNLSTILAGLAD
jgi:zinc/manganese transport system substrate-binding protein